MLQLRGHLTCLRPPRYDAAVCGAAEQVAATRAKAATVDPVTVTRERREGKLREISRAVNTEGLITGGGGEEGRGEGAAAHLIRVVPESLNE